MASNPAANPQGSLQYIRNFNLTVTGSNVNGLDLSALHCKFSIKRSSNMTPNCADIRVYNLDADTALKIRQQYTKVIVQAGYNSNFGVVFKGNIKQVIIGRESATDTFIDLNCGDGDLAYNYAVVSAAIETADQFSVFNQIAQPMYGLGLNSASNQPSFKPTILPRGKTMFGNSRDFLRTFSNQNDLTWSIQNEQITFVKQQGYQKGVSVVLNSKTGMIGTPQQTNIGINVVNLINPLINPGQTVQVDQASIARLKIDLGNPKDPVNLAPDIRLDGVYYVLVVEHTGDNRGIDWYSKLICCTVNQSVAAINSVAVSYGP